jgi:peptidoglycan/xylan/chitin deacetylase (PgdA/CDA1 family)
MKYMVISFDDNTDYDRKAVELLNKYGIKGTFYINSGTLGKPGYVSADELKTLYVGHEVASHTIGHLHLTGMSEEEITYQIKEDVAMIEDYTKEKVHGFAYPFGEFNDKVKSVVKELGLSYARTIDGSKEFDRPKHFLEWNPTMHISGMAWNTDDDDRRSKGIKFMFDKVEEFLDDEDYELELLHIWLHSWELANDAYKWDELERLFRIISQEDVYSVTAYQYFKKVKGIK